MNVVSDAFWDHLLGIIGDLFLEPIGEAESLELLTTIDLSLWCTVSVSSIHQCFLSMASAPQIAEEAMLDFVRSRDTGGGRGGCSHLSWEKLYRWRRRDHPYPLIRETFQVSYLLKTVNEIYILCKHVSVWKQDLCNSEISFALLRE